MNTTPDLRAGEVAAAIRRNRLIVVMRRVEPRSRLLALADALAETGARAFEVTMDAGSGEAADARMVTGQVIAVDAG